MNFSEIKDLLKAEAEKLGFSYFGFTGTEPLNDFSIFESWLRKNVFGTMNYLNRPDTLAKRADLQLLMPDARSVMVLGTAVSQPVTQTQFKIASFAHYYDYHEQIADRCDQLIQRVSQLAGTTPKYLVCVDAKPVLERSLAVRAGLGWIGRSSMLIHPSFGSFNLLSEIFLSWELPPDEPYAADGCGDRRRCAEACPAGCIDPEARLIDASRCISYLTIEHKGDFPSQRAAERCGDWVFGCDVCMAVCPWNQKAIPVESYLKSFDFAEDLESDLFISESEFKQKYKKSPVSRIKSSGWKRNLRNAIANQK